MEVAQLILDTHAPREINKAPQVMFDLLTLEYQQNPKLRKKLLATGDKKLFKSTQSKFWGSGYTIPMIDRQVKHGQVKITGKNTLGAQSEDVRRDLIEANMDKDIIATNV